jgi:hypothetical protein
LSPSFTMMGSSVEKVLTLVRSMVISPAASVRKMSLPPVALTILPVRRSPLRKITSSARAGVAASTNDAKRAIRAVHMMSSWPRG